MSVVSVLTLTEPFSPTTVSRLSRRHRFRGLEVAAAPTHPCGKEGKGKEDVDVDMLYPPRVPRQCKARHLKRR